MISFFRETYRSFFPHDEKIVPKSIKKTLFQFDYSFYTLLNFVIWFGALISFHIWNTAVERRKLPRIENLPNVQPFPFTLHLRIIKNQNSVNVDTVSEHWNDKVRNLNNQHQQYKLFSETSFFNDNEINFNLNEKRVSEQLQIKHSMKNSEFMFIIQCSSKDEMGPLILGIERHAWKTFPCQNLENSQLNFLDDFLKLLFSPRIEYPVKVTPYMTLSFSLLNSYPTRYWSYSWNWKEIYFNFLQPFLEKVETIFNPIIEAQVLHYGDIVEGTLQSSGEGKCVLEKDLREFMGNTDWNIVSTLDTDRTVELLVYIPDEEEVPLTICEMGQNSLNSSFVVPRWGSVVIYNPNLNENRGEEGKQILSTNELLHVFQKLISHVRSMLGLPNADNLEDVKMIHSEVGISSWEIDYLMRTIGFEYLSDVKEMLTSTQELVDNNAHLPITANVAEIIYNAVEKYNLALEACSLGKYENCARAAKESFHQAKIADQHHEMLPMLHFSLKFTYATYAPFFLPSFVPVLHAFLNRIKYTLMDDE